MSSEGENLPARRRDYGHQMMTDFDPDDICFMDCRRTGESR